MDQWYPQPPGRKNHMSPRGRRRVKRLATRVVVVGAFLAFVITAIYLVNKGANWYEVRASTTTSVAVHGREIQLTINPGMGASEIGRLLEQKKAGVIRRLGFSFHGTVDFLKYLMENHEWDVVQIQCNYYDWEGEENSKEKYEIITAHNTPVIVMEPIRGGMLANPNPDARDLMKKAEPKASPSSWALRYVASLPNVMVILSGMSAMEHVQDNIRTLSNFKPLTDAERGILAQALVYIKGAPLIRCTGCHYCMPCPFGVDIPGNFAVYNDLVNEKLIPYLDQKGTPDYERRKRAFFNYYSKMEDKTLYDRCVKCGRCMRLCPQHIRIPQELQKIRTLSDGLKATEAKV